MVEFPSGLIPPEAFSFNLDAPSTVFRSLFTRKSQKAIRLGRRWRMSFSYNGIDHHDAGVLRAFLAELQDSGGVFRCHNLGRPLPRGTATQTFYVDGAGQVGATVNVSGKAGTLAAGDMVAINGELKMIVADHGTSISFGPILRTPPPHGAVVQVVRPQATFLLTTEKPQITQSHDYTASTSLEAMAIFT